jgi:hypothetical protein
VYVKGLGAVGVKTATLDAKKDLQAGREYS